VPGNENSRPVLRFVARISRQINQKSATRVRKVHTALVKHRGSCNDYDPLIIITIPNSLSHSCESSRRGDDCCFTRFCGKQLPAALNRQTANSRSVSAERRVQSLPWSALVGYQKLA